MQEEGAQEAAITAVPPRMQEPPGARPQGPGSPRELQPPPPPPPLSVGQDGVLASGSDRGVASSSSAAPALSCSSLCTPGPEPGGDACAHAETRAAPLDEPLVRGGKPGEDEAQVVPTVSQQEHLVRGLEDLAAAELAWGSDDARVALLLRRLALDFERAGRARQALPLWLRVLEIESPALGSSHPDVLQLSDRVRGLLGRSGLAADAVEAFEGRLPRPPKVAAPLAEVVPWAADLAPTRDRSASGSSEVGRLTSLGVAMASSVGGAVVGGALNLGFAAASATSSLATDAVGSVASYGARRLSGVAVRAVAPAGVAEPVASVVEWAAGATCSAATGTAKLASSVVMGVAQQTAVTTVSSVTAQALNYAGQTAVYSLSSTSQDTVGKPVALPAKTWAGVQGAKPSSAPAAAQGSKVILAEAYSELAPGHTMGATQGPMSEAPGHAMGAS